MINRFLQLPRSLAEKSRTMRLIPESVHNPDGSRGVPALITHPDWISSVPTVIWLHGRTAYKELDSGRYARLLRTGIAAVAIDLPGHGERLDSRGEEQRGAPTTLEVMQEALGEIDRVIEALADPVWQNAFDLDRLAIGGMSLGGMIALRRLCEPHEFKCVSVESSCGDLDGLYNERTGTHPWGISYPAEKIRSLDPMQNLDGFRPLPVLALHSEADAIVPWRVQRGFLAALRAQYGRAGVDPEQVAWRTWENTGAPQEHSGFGRVANEAKTLQIEFLRMHLAPGAAGALDALP
jgi:alpha-beta hydrolase superfamily lysophospholipase